MNRLLALVVLVLATSVAHALGFDHFDEREDTGVWRRSNQKAVASLLFVGVVGTAVWQGTDTELGRTSWQAIDATLATAATTEAMKRVFGRPRPAQDPDPGHWFRGSRYHSFPSGDVAMVASAVTPYILAYHEEQPAVWALAALPVYMGYARMTSQAHWLTDVLAGAAVGVALGYWASRRDQPLILVVSGKGGFVGWRTKF
jgi:undecaprenyl-diphosphatase